MKIENIAVLSTESIGGNVDILVGVDIITKGNFTITNTSNPNTYQSKIAK